jgi:parvulin-like peptidyl-prolyl isomerase
MGDASLLSSEMVDVSVTEVTNQFGEEFTKQLTQLPKGRWVGPVTSAYGVHLVLVSERSEGGIPKLADAHDAVRREWENTRLKEVNEKFYQELLKNYTVTVEKPEPEKTKK